MVRVGETMPVTTEERRYELWARQHYENFTVASLLLPRRLRRPVRLLYAYCRYVDDLGDEAPGDRLALLEDFEQDVLRCFSTVPRHPLLRAFQPVIEEFRLPKEPLLKLIAANKMDQRISRYESYADLLVYCDHSANPVGHLFLALLGYFDERRRELADATCTALQLTNFLQDISLDYDKGRIYIPLEDMRRFGVAEEDIARRRMTAAFQELMAFEVKRARDLFGKGLPLTGMIDGLAKLDVRLFSYGGLAVLDALETGGYDVFTKRPVVTKRRKALLFLQAVRWLLTPALRRAEREGTL